MAGLNVIFVHYARGSAVVEALCYNPEGRRFETGGGT
jgi:hypothetical protein